MDFRVEFSEQAQGDIAAVYDWLESQAAGPARIVCTPSVDDDTREHLSGRPFRTHVPSRRGDKCSESSVDGR
jgi:hypothetical protein